MFQCRQGHGQLDSVRSSSSRHKQWTQGQQQAVHKAAVGAQMEARQGEEGVGHHARGHPVTAAKRWAGGRHGTDEGEWKWEEAERKGDGHYARVMRSWI
eukprot:1149027-Pelagomonas_calceolata.AAC.3